MYWVYYYIAFKVSRDLIASIMTGSHFEIAMKRLWYCFQLVMCSVSYYVYIYILLCQYVFYIYLCVFRSRELALFVITPGPCTLIYFEYTYNRASSLSSKSLVLALDVTSDFISCSSIYKLYSDSEAWAHTFYLLL